MINRRNWLKLTSCGLISTLVTYQSARSSKVLAQSRSGQGVTIEWLGHSCFLFTSPGVRVLSNPFSPLGCTAKYKTPQREADLVMISSRLLDEGAAAGLPNNPQLMVEAGVYDLKGIEFQGINTFHDREKGRRFGNNVVWKWNQGGVKILHLGGIASPIGIEQKILMGTPDIALIPIGGTAKTYNPQEALEAIKMLNPKMMIPTQYLTKAAQEDECELTGVDQFLNLAQQEGMNIKVLPGNRLTVKSQDLPPEGTLIRVFNDQNLIVQ
jgi:L-ascorbate metabolism protein UlaG (beta-lactamase superfamily)